MRALVQRVTRAHVSVTAPGGGPGVPEVVGRIGPGLCVLVGVTHGDTDRDARQLASRLWHLRVFTDADGLMNRSAADDGRELLVVSQFTLYADTRKGRRPSFVAAAAPEVAEPLIEVLCDELKALGARVCTGRFRADMAVELVNDGPVTVMLEVPAAGSP